MVDKQEVESYMEGKDTDSATKRFSEATPYSISGADILYSDKEELQFGLPAKTVIDMEPAFADALMDYNYNPDDIEGIKIKFHINWESGQASWNPADANTAFESDSIDRIVPPKLLLTVLIEAKNSGLAIPSQSDLEEIVSSLKNSEYSRVFSGAFEKGIFEEV